MCWRYDEDGYFDQPVACQVFKGKLLMADRSTDIEPPLELLETHFAKFDGSQWVVEKKPATPEECAALGDLDHQSQTKRIVELREIFEKVCEGSTTFRVEQDPDTLAKRVVPIPPEEGIAADADRELYAFDAQIASIKDRLLTAVLIGDVEAQEAIRAEYAALMKGGE